ncbi:MAG: thioredoxin family protein [Magnetococcales bacterium]|nr:thioredoxin family protein [Magnetococcales bacterium]MBF0438263.1 thioredoxin family protein [Magnetococcales bacterium]
MVLLHSPPGELGSLAPDFSLPGVDGKIHTLGEYQKNPVLVVMFICNHCPYVLAIEDRLIALTQALMPQNVQFVAISSNDPTNYPEDSFDNMKLRAKKKSYPFAYLYDATQQIAKDYGAVCTPDFFVYDAERKLRYRGRLDDSPRNPVAVRKQEMKEAILALLEGRPVATIQNTTMGCSIKWKES